MARRLPDMAEHGRHLDTLGRRALSAMAVQRSIKEPEAYWLDGAAWESINGYLKGGGLDVARGFVFHGVPIKKF